MPAARTGALRAHSSKADSMHFGHPALAQLRCLISRFGGADTPGWAAPADSELREHLTGYVLNGYLGEDVSGKAVMALSRLAARWREGLVIIEDDPLHARVGRQGLPL